METISVYIPRPGTHLGIDPGSGVVARPLESRLLLDFEGNRHGAVNLVTWADRVQVAAGRALSSYPTTARRAADLTDLELVGYYDDHSGSVVLDPSCEESAAAWLGTTELAAECLTTGARHQNRRLLATMRAGTPEQQFLARHYARVMDP